MIGRLVTVILELGAVVLLVVQLVGTFTPWLSTAFVPWYLDNDFAHIYLTGDLVRTGLNAYDVDIAPLYSAHGFTPTFATHNVISPTSALYPSTPPSLALIVAPLTLLPPLPAFVLWSGLQLGCLVMGLLALMKFFKLRISAPTALVVLCAAAVSPSTIAHLRYGQSQMMIFGLTVLGLLLIERREPWLSRLGLVFWGMSVSLKLFTIPLVYVAWRYRGARGVFWFCVGFISLLLPFVATCGFDALTSYVLKALPDVQTVANEYNGNISLSGSLVHLQRISFGYDAVSPKVLHLVCALLVPVVLFFDWRAPGDLAATVLTVLVASCLLSPTSWLHYLTILSGVYIYLLAHIQSKPHPKPPLLLITWLYICSGFASGRLTGVGPFLEIASSVCGPLCMIGMLVLLFSARTDSRPAAAEQLAKSNP